MNVAHYNDAAGRAMVAMHYADWDALRAKAELSDAVVHLVKLADELAERAAGRRNKAFEDALAAYTQARGL